jgi:hypothetical protein
MRARFTVFAALLAPPALATLSARAAHAQPAGTGTILQQYIVRGCIDGPIAYNPRFGPPTIGRVACLDGIATVRFFELLPGDGQAPIPILRLESTLTATFGEAFTPESFYAEAFGVNFAFDREGGCAIPSTCRGAFITSGSGSLVGAWRRDAPTVTYRTLDEPLRRDVILGSVRDLRASPYFRYRLSNSPDPQGEFANADITYTLTPEPSTLALAGAGLLALGAAARRRKR